MKYLIHLNLFFILFSCGKEHSIKGRVFNPVTDEAISGIKVNLLKNKTEIPGSQDGVGKKIVESTTTNENGEYSFTFRKKDSRQYSLSFFYDDKKYYDNIKSGNVVIENNMVTYDLPLVNYGFLSKNISNVNCFNENDLLSIVFSHQDVIDYSFGNLQEYEGCYSHFGNTNSIPMGMYKYEGTVTKNGITTPIKDSIYVTAGGYHTWNIQY